MIDDSRKPVEVGFEYVCNHDDTMIFRKRIDAPFCGIEDSCANRMSLDEETDT